MTRKYFEVSHSFDTVSEFNKVYKETRKIILERHGFKEGDRVVLKNAVMLLKSWDNENYLPYTSIASDMKDNIKFEHDFGNGNVTYKFASMV